MKRTLLLILIIFVSCNQNKSRHLSLDDLRKDLVSDSLLSEKETLYLSGVSNTENKDSILSILREAFIRDFPASIQNYLHENNSTFNEALQAILYPSRDGPVLLKYTGEEKIVLKKKSARFISLLRQYQMIPDSVEINLRGELEKEVILFKVDVLNKLEH